MIEDLAIGTEIRIGTGYFDKPFKLPLPHGEVVTWLPNYAAMGIYVARVANYSDSHSDYCYSVRTKLANNSYYVIESPAAMDWRGLCANYARLMDTWRHIAKPATIAIHLIAEYRHIDTED